MQLRRLLAFHPPELDESQAAHHQPKGRDGGPLPAKRGAFDLGISANLVGAVGKLVAQGLDRLDLAQAWGTLEDVDLKLVLRGGIKLAAQVFFSEFVPIQLPTLHSAPE